MKSKGYHNFLILYFTIFSIIALSAFTLEAEYFRERLVATIIVTVTLIVFPFIIIAFAENKPAFAKWLRIFSFKYFPINAFIRLFFFAILILVLFLIYNYFKIGLSKEFIFLCLFVLSVTHLFFLSLTISGRLKIHTRSSLLIGAKESPKVFLYDNIKGGIRHIPDPTTLHMLGYTFDEVQYISSEELKHYTEYPSLESVSTARLVRPDGKPEVYIIINERKHHVPNHEILNFLQQLNRQINGTRNIDVLPEIDVNKWPTEKPLLNVI